jgi:hypothetical protein
MGQLSYDFDKVVNLSRNVSNSSLLDTKQSAYKLSEDFVTP